MTTRFRARQLAHDLRGNLLLRPALITVGLAIGALIFLQLDHRGAGRAFIPSFIEEPAVAQTVLTAIAGSVIGVISIVYSVLVMSLTMASMQFSPRILSAFLRDPISQNVLGVFTGTFLYCLAALRGVRSEPPSVPPLTVAGAVVLALAAVAALIYFINHIAREIQVNHIIARIARQTAMLIEQELPAGSVDAAAVPLPVPNEPVGSNRSGYVQLVDVNGLAEVAARHGVSMGVVALPGDFVPEGAPLVRVSPAVKSSIHALIRRAWDLGPMRTMQQDVSFGIRQIVDIGLKAISPAVNDPSTCATCIDHLDDLIRRLAARAGGTRTIGGTSTPRVVLPAPAFADYLALAFNQLRQYGRGDLAVANRLMRAFADINAVTADPQRRDAVRQQARLLMEGLDPRFAAEDRVELEERYRMV